MQTVGLGRYFADNALGTLITIAYSYYKYATYWKNRGVPSIWPLPILGNFESNIFKKTNIAYVIENLYKLFSGKRYAGIYHTTVTALMVRDPDLIKKILVKEFETFPQHREFIPDGIDTLWSKNMFAMRGGKKWQQIRSTLSPSFTSSKMKMMFNLIQECSTNFVNHFLEKEKVLTLEMKDIFSKFTNDVITTTAFGVACDSLKNPENEFHVHGQKISGADGFQGIIFFLYMAIPNIMKLTKISLFPPSSKDFFMNVIKSAIALRKREAIIRPDMIHLMMEASKNNLTEEEVDENDSGFAVVKESSKINYKGSKMILSDEDIVAQAILFFFAGFDASSTMMSYAAYELAVNPDVQDKLQKEVDKTLEKCNGKITYEALIGMKYLDMVISETLRNWPPAPFNDREAVRPFTIEPEHPDETPLTLNAGQIITIPTYAIQRDPQYFPNPDKFDPERFSEENKDNIKPFTYMPFGAGPRFCIGSRFALLEGKLLLFDIISKFVLVPVEKTPIPIVLGRKKFDLVPDEGFWLGFKPRSK